MQAANVTAKAYMDTWLLQINYPEVAVILDNNGTNTELTFKQERYTVTVIDEEYLFVPIESPFK
jgi:aminopeptidase N